MKFTILFLSPATLLLASVALGDFDSGSDGSDGVFEPYAADITIDLGEAMTASWDTPNTQNPGAGIYDPDLWCVVFKYQSVNISDKSTVSFINHPSGAPVVWLVQGDVQIDNTININGQNSPSAGDNDTLFIRTVPGPGGFQGGSAGTTTGGQDYAGSAGFGPGGGDSGVNGGSLVFTNGSSLIPLIGGSGGGGTLDYYSVYDYPGGAGGGAMLIAANGIIQFGSSGRIYAIGGSGYYVQSAYRSGGGSGGAVRLIASDINGSIDIEVDRGSGGSTGTSGRVRIESYDITGASFGEISPSYALSLGQPGIVLPPSNTPRLRVVSCGGVPVPADPTAQLIFPDVVVGAQSVEVIIEAENVPLSAFVRVQVRPGQGAHWVHTASPLTDDDGDGIATCTAVIILHDSEFIPASIQATASW